MAGWGHIPGHSLGILNVTDDTPTTTTQTPDECPHCGKQPILCICEEIVALDNRVSLLILQHPQEQDKTLGSARLAVHMLSNAIFKVGLSWSSLAKALGRPADPKNWAILHLGSIQASDFPDGRDIAVFDAKGVAVADQTTALNHIEGVVIFDGTWSQAKTLWWRNAWVLKARRIALRPSTPSRYGNLRKEPRKEGLSSIEAAGMVLSRLETDPRYEEALGEAFAVMLSRFKAAKKAGLVSK